MAFDIALAVPEFVRSHQFDCHVVQVGLDAGQQGSRFAVATQRQHEFAAAADEGQAQRRCNDGRLPLHDHVQRQPGTVREAQHGCRTLQPASLFG